VLEKISVEKGPNLYDKLLSAEHWESKHVRGRHAEHHACFVKPGCSFIGPEIGMFPSSDKPSKLNLHPSSIPNCIAQRLAESEAHSNVSLPSFPTFRHI